MSFKLNTNIHACQNNFFDWKFCSHGSRSMKVKHGQKTLYSKFSQKSRKNQTLPFYDYSCDHRYFPGYIIKEY